MTIAATIAAIVIVAWLIGAACAFVLLHRKHRAEITEYDHNQARRVMRHMRSGL
jgi:hypothetical protein